MFIDKEYPATHSMSTGWFIADKDGNVAIFDFNENGPIPCDIPQSSANGVLEEDFVLPDEKGIRNFNFDDNQADIIIENLGGGEPFECEGIFEIIDALYPITYLSVTSNGLPLLKRDVFEKLLKHSPDKIHLTIHNPDNQKEVIRVIEQVVELSKTKIKPGVNLLVSSYCIAECQEVYAKLLETLPSNQIILIPKRFGDTPTAKQMAFVANGKPFQSPSCLLKCEIPSKFVSVSWDKKVNHCSYAGGKEPLRTLDYAGLVDALKRVVFSNCSKRINLHSQTE